MRPNQKGGRHHTKSEGATNTKRGGRKLYKKCVTNTKGERNQQKGDATNPIGWRHHSQKGAPPLQKCHGFLFFVFVDRCSVLVGDDILQWWSWWGERQVKWSVHDGGRREQSVFCGRKREDEGGDGERRKRELSVWDGGKSGLCG